MVTLISLFAGMVFVTFCVAIGFFIFVASEIMNKRKK